MRSACHTVCIALALFGALSGSAPAQTNTATISTASEVIPGATPSLYIWTTTYVGPQTVRVDAQTGCTATVTLPPSGCVPSGGTGTPADPLMYSCKVPLTGCTGGALLFIAAGGQDIDTFLFSVDPPTPNDANLSALAVSSGNLSPAFAPGTLSYTDTVTNCVASIKVTPTLEDPAASVKVNGVAVTSGAHSAPISLAVGANAINVVVTAHDGTTTQTYALAVTREAPAANAPILQSAASRKVHGAAGTFDLMLSAVTTTPTTEPRRGPAQTVVFTFDKAINGATASVDEGIATAATPTFSGNDVVVGLTGVTDQQYVTVGLDSVASTDGGSGGCGVVRVGFLVGDVSQNRVVTVSDLAQVNAQLAQIVTSANFLKDVNASGTLSVADKAITNANLTRNLPAP
jgi:Cadherin-like beta sandwich domain